jgi:hypothetical protein
MPPLTLDEEGPAERQAFASQRPDPADALYRGGRIGTRTTRVQRPRLPSASMNPILAANPYVIAVLGFAGALRGGFIAGTVSLLVAKHTRDAAERAWIRDSRRQIYDRFLTAAESC